jgi:hypothetical protein
MKTFFFGQMLILLTLWSGQFVTAQTDSDPRIYRIYLGVVETSEDLKDFDKLQNLGFLHPLANVSRGGDRIAPGIRVYLGHYLDQITAANILLQCWALGYKNAYLETDAQTLTYGIGSELTYSLQLGAYRKLSLQKFQSLQRDLPYGIFVRYEDGLFKVLGGLYTSFEIEKVRREVIPYLHKQGFQPYLKQFREPYIKEGL